MPTASDTPARPQKEIKTIYEYDPDGTRRIKSETVIRKQVGPDLAAITFALTNLDPQHWRAKPETGADASPADWSDWSDEALREIAGTGAP